jgi:hypothetical protein
MSCRLNVMLLPLMGYHAGVISPKAPGVPYCANTGTDAARILTVLRQQVSRNDKNQECP